MQIGEIGKGIAQRRKQLGLSQEELAQRLHVTRQAVSKWESGAALPSVDNIVELSHILNISVDELLQLPHEDPEPALSAQSVGRLLDEQSIRHEKRIRRLTWILVAAVIVLVAGITLSTVLNVTRTNRMEQNVQWQNQQILSTIASMQASMTTSVRDALTDSSTLLADGGCQSFDYVHSDRAVHMRVFAYPKELHAPEQASFYALLPDGGRVSVPAEMVDGGFEGTLMIPDNGEQTLSVSVYVSWTEDGKTLTEILLNHELWLDELRLRLFDLYFNCGNDDGTQMEIWPYLLMRMPPYRTDRQPVSVRWEVFVEDTLVHEEESPFYGESGMESACATPDGQFFRVSAASPEVITVRATVTDGSGNVFVREVAGP